MKILTKVAALLMVASALLSCNKEPINNEPDSGKTDEPGVETEIEYTEDIEFSIEILSVEAHTVKLKVEHTGTKDDTWYGFATTSTNVGVALDDMIEELTKNEDEKVEGLLKGRKKNITLDELKSSTEYRYIVFAITPEGDVYGTEEYVIFKTPMGYDVNPAWNVEYTARQFIGENEYEHTITVKSTDENPYFMTVVTKERFDNTEIEALLADELDAFLEFIDNYNMYYNIDSTVEDWDYIGSGIDAFGLELGYTYVAMAIGVTGNGELTGLYAISEEFEPVEEEMTPEYASWIGDWTFTGANGVAFDVNISKEKSNFSYIMTGWEGPEAKRHKVILDWYPNSNTWFLYSQFIGTFTSTGYGDFDLYFTAGNYDTDGEHVYMTEGLIICIGGEQKDGKVVVGYSENDKSLYTHMRFAGLWSDGVGGITATSKFPTFPLTVTPKSATKSLSETPAPITRQTVPFNVPLKSLYFSMIH